MSRNLDRWCDGNLEQCERFVRVCRLTGIHKRDSRVNDKYLLCVDKLDAYIQRTTQFMERLDAQASTDK